MVIEIHNTHCKVLISGVDDMALRKATEGEHKKWMPTLRAFLRERPPGYYFAPTYKKRIWDGYQYFISATGVFATGFLTVIPEYIWKLVPGLEIEFLDKRTNLPLFKDDFELELGNGWSMAGEYAYQADCVGAIDNYLMLGEQELYFPRGILDLATNAGKTSIIAGLGKNLENPRILFVTDSKVIHGQSVEFFSQMFEVGQVSDKKMDMSGELVVAMSQTLSNRIAGSVNVKKDMQGFNVLVFDEAHRAATKAGKTIYQSTNAGIRLLMSGTPLDMDDRCKRMTLFGMSGKVLKKISNDDLIKSGVSVKPIVSIHLNKMDFGFSYTGSYEELVNSTSRMDKIVELVRGTQSHVLITVNFKHHAELLYERLKQAGIDRIAWSHGDDPRKAEVLQEFKKDLRVLIATPIIREGYNNKKIGMVIYAGGGKSKISVKQIVGRGLRKDESQDFVEVHDFYDDDRKTLAFHSRKRIKYYRQEGFEVDLKYAHNRGFPV
jgi:superfamily II DNA or RNA helicase